MSWGGRWLPEVLHWSELFVVMVPTVIGVLVMLPRTRSVEGRGLVRGRSGMMGLGSAGVMGLIWPRGCGMLGPRRQGPQRGE